MGSKSLFIDKKNLFCDTILHIIITIYKHLSIFTHSVEFKISMLSHTPNLTPSLSALSPESSTCFVTPDGGLRGALSSCGHHGTCQPTHPGAPNKCVCEAGYTGQYCHISEFHFFKVF